MPLWLSDTSYMTHIDFNFITEAFRIKNKQFLPFSLLNKSPIFQSLPAPVKRRLKALKKIQLESTKIEAKFYEEVHKLECKYHEMYKPLYEKRGKITKGKQNPFPDPFSKPVFRFL